MKQTILSILALFVFSIAFGGQGTSGGNPGIAFYNQTFNYFINYFEDYKVDNQNNKTVLIHKDSSFVRIESEDTTIADVSTFINTYNLTNCSQTVFSGLNAFNCSNNQIYVFIPKNFVHIFNFSNDDKAKKILESFKTPLSLIIPGSEVEILTDIHSEKQLFFQDGKVITNQNSIDLSKPYCHIKPYSLEGSYNPLPTLIQHPISFYKGDRFFINTLLGEYGEKFNTYLSLTGYEFNPQIKCTNSINTAKELSIYELQNVFKNLIGFNSLNINLQEPPLGNLLSSINFNKSELFINKPIAATNAPFSEAVGPFTQFQFGKPTHQNYFKPYCSLQFKKGIYSIPSNLNLKIISASGLYVRTKNYSEKISYHTSLVIQENPYLERIDCHKTTLTFYDVTDYEMLEAFGDYVDFELSY